MNRQMNKEKGVHMYKKGIMRIGLALVLLAALAMVVAPAAAVTHIDAGFTASPTSGDAPLSVSFTDTTTFGSYSSCKAWIWYYNKVGDGLGDIQFSTSQNPSNAFAAGTYDIKLVVSGRTGPGCSGSSDSDTEEKYSSAGSTYIQVSVPDCSQLTYTCGNSLGDCVSSCQPSGCNQECQNVCSANCQYCTPSIEVCDGVDNDCDQAVDEGLGTTSCGLGVCAHTIDNCVGGQTQVCNPLQGAGTESCNGLDDDCDGVVDDGNPGGGVGCNTQQPGVCAAGTTQCSAGAIVCNQNVQSSTEICDGLDNDCDGLVDEGLGTTSCGVGECARIVDNCVGGVTQTCTPGASTPEVCDGLDNDCNGAIDNGGNTLCDDDNDCTNDVCNQGCQYTNVQIGTDCNDDGVCDGAGHCVFCLFNRDCDDANVCNGAETCVAGSCQVGTPLACNDNDVCNGVETCNPSSGCVAGTPLVCNDGNACNGLETCDALLGCQLGTPVECPFGQDCTPATGQCIDKCQSTECADDETCHYGVCIQSECSDDMTVSPAADPLSGETPMHVHFAANPSPDWDNGNTQKNLFEWDFGDGADSSQKNPSHNYNNGGVFTASVDATWQTRIVIGQHYEHRHSGNWNWHPVESCTPGHNCKLVTEYSDWYTVCDQKADVGPITVEGYDTPYVTGMKFADRNQNGIKDEDEDGLADYTITLYKFECGRDRIVSLDVVEDGHGFGCDWVQYGEPTVTDEDGVWYFEGISTFGLFKAEETLKDGDTQTFPLDGHTHDYITKDGAYYFMVIGHETNEGFDFGNFNPRMIQSSLPMPWSRGLSQYSYDCDYALKDKADQILTLPAGGAPLKIEVTRWAGGFDGAIVWTKQGGEVSFAPMCNGLEWWSDQCVGTRMYGYGPLVFSIPTPHGKMRVLVATEESSTSGAPAGEAVPPMTITITNQNTGAVYFSQVVTADKFDRTFEFAPDYTGCILRPELADAGWGKWFVTPTPTPTPKSTFTCPAGETCL